MARQSKHSRLQVAHKAAQIMAEEGINDYAFAKHKAAKYFGFTEKKELALPSNDEINLAIKEYQKIFLDPLSQENLSLLRLEALKIMEDLNRFNPYLISFIDENTSYPTTKTLIHLYTDNTKELELFLLNKSINYKSSHKKYYYSINLEGMYGEIILNIFSENYQHSKLKKISIKNLKKLLNQTSQ